jgi:hypothetical protein
MAALSGEEEKGACEVATAADVAATVDVAVAAEVGDQPTEAGPTATAQQNPKPMPWTNERSRLCGFFFIFFFLLKDGTVPTEGLHGLSLKANLTRKGARTVIKKPIIIRKGARTVIKKLIIIRKGAQTAIKSQLLLLEKMRGLSLGADYY